jgi:hypothetical protein
MRILDSSAAIRKAITDLMAPGKARRVAITAFVGDGARAFIRNPKGVEIICWPKAGGTNPLELRRLKKAGARIRFADRVHMKVYWAARRGTIITSANLSTNALGTGNLKEFGVFLPADAVNIDDVIESIKSRPLNNKDLQELELEHRKLSVSQRRQVDKIDKVLYPEWFSLRPLNQWKLGWWDEDCALAKNAEEIIRTDFGRRTACDWVTSKEGDYKKHDWVLSFQLTKKGATGPRWIYVELLEKVNRNDERAFYEDRPYQAIQVWSPKHYTSPPFVITKNFRTALRQASLALGVSRIKKLRSVRPPSALLAMIEKSMN